MLLAPGTGVRAGRMLPPALLTGYSRGVHIEGIVTERRNTVRALKLLAASVMLSSLLGLAACGGGGSYGGGGNMPVTGVGPSKVFAADSGHRAIGSLANPDPGAGPIAIDRTIIGPVYTGLSS